MRYVMTVLFLAGCVAVATGQEVSRKRIAWTIEEGVDFLLGQQQADGGWGSLKDKEDMGGLPVAKSALVTMALMHANLPKSAPAQTKGFAFVVQHEPERATYSAGAVLSMLYKQGHPEKYSDLINEYIYRLIRSQKITGVQAGSWGYNLEPYGPKDEEHRNTSVDDDIALRWRSDQSNMQFAVLALHFARLSGYQVPRKTWEMVKAYYVGAQHTDGGWAYYGDAYARTTPGGNVGASNNNMTIASTISLYLVEEALQSTEHRQCRPPDVSRAYEAGVKWLTDNWKGKLDTYGWYAIERLGILTGRSNFGSHDWFEEGAQSLTTDRNWTVDQGDKIASTALAVLFLARGLEPIVINKLQRTGDWNNDPYDIQHVAEYISQRFQKPVQWRVITLDASMEQLLRVPILFLNGHEKLVFTDEEKAKLKGYVEKGGCIFGMACCGKKPFNDSFRALIAELFPESKLIPLPESHDIYTTPKRLANKPRLEELRFDLQKPAPAVIYSPYDFCCQWSTGGGKSTAPLDLAANICFYVTRHSPLTKEEAATPEVKP